MSLISRRNACCPVADVRVWTEKTQFEDRILGAIILSLTVLGALGNFSLLCHYLFINCNRIQVRGKDLIFIHLTIANALVIVSQGVPWTMAGMGLRPLFGEIGCYTVFYVQRLGRGVSIEISCLLSVFQAIKISPMNSCLKGLKVKAPQYVTIFIFLSWIFDMFINLGFPLNFFLISSKLSLENITNQRVHKFCYMDYIDDATVPIYVALFVFPEVLFAVPIVWASGSMIVFLLRHKRRVQHIHRIPFAPRSSAETKATQRILVQVSTFLCFYTVTSLFNMCFVLGLDQNAMLIKISDIISLCFPTVSPFLLIRPDSILFRESFSLNVCKKSVFLFTTK